MWAWWCCTADSGQALLLLGPAGAQIVRVHVAGDDLRLHGEDAPHVGHGLLEELVGRQVFEVADVLAQEGLVAPGEADGVFELARRRPGPAAACACRNTGTGT